MIASAASCPAVGPRIGQGRRQAGLDAVVRQRLHDHAGGKRQHLLGRKPSRAAERGAGASAPAPGPSAPVPALALPVLTRMARSLCAGGQVLAAQLHRRGAEAVGGEDAGDRCARDRASTTVRSRRLALRMPAMAVPRVTPRDREQQ